ncbi:hypothetical protein ACKVMH_10875 [Lysobacter zhanggongensis]|uniref:Secreted protein n=1 Tax=Lysobacter zhanggongensis TaxID=1774951 RepID=A0ABU7YS51_9GAMM
MDKTLNAPRALLAATLAVALSACSPNPAAPDPAGSTASADASPDAPAATAQDAFLDRLGALCGQAFAGTIAANEPPSTTPDAFEGKPLVMHVRECSDAEIRIPFHVGDDRSRTWVVTRTDDGLRLKHDHRHEDGSDDAVTMYGGDTADTGSAGRQEFPVDGFSREMFSREGMEVSNANVWAIEVEPGEQFVYELARPGSPRLFRVAFDLTRPVTLPPAPWGADSAPAPAAD